MSSEGRDGLRRCWTRVSGKLEEAWEGNEWGLRVIEVLHEKDIIRSFSLLFLIFHKNLFACSYHY